MAVLIGRWDHGKLRTDADLITTTILFVVIEGKRFFYELRKKGRIVVMTALA